MLKLTRLDDNARNVWIVPRDIIAITEADRSTTIWTHHHCFFVTETAEQILAMPEMQIIAASYRPTIVPNGLTWDGYNSNLKVR